MNVCCFWHINHDRSCYNHSICQSVNHSKHTCRVPCVSNKSQAHHEISEMKEITFQNLIIYALIQSQPAAIIQKCTTLHCLLDHQVHALKRHICQPTKYKSNSFHSTNNICQKCTHLKQCTSTV